MDVKDFQEFLINATNEELTELMLQLRDATGFDAICERINDLITLY